MQLISGDDQFGEDPHALQACVPDVSDLIPLEQEGAQVSKGQQVLRVKDADSIVGEIKDLKKLETFHEVAEFAALEGSAQFVAGQTERLELMKTLEYRPELSELIRAEIKVGQGLMEYVKEGIVDRGESVVGDIHVCDF